MGGLTGWRGRAGRRWTAGLVGLLGVGLLGGCVMMSSDPSAVQAAGVNAGATASGCWVIPGSGPVNSPYGYRIHPITGEYKMHAGVDLGGKDNPIYAAADGTVTEFKKGSLGGTNTSVVIDHGGGVFTRYLHMFVDEVLVEVGDQVVAGQQIAQNGMTGSATGEHLHFEVYESGMNGGTSDPAAFYEALGLNLGSDPGGTPQPGCLTAQASTLPDSGAGSGQWSGVKGQAYALLPSFGWTDETEMVCLSELWEHESNWNATAVNSSSGACGIPQALPCSKMAKAGADYATNPVTQIRWGLDYIKGRYGSPCAAWEFWQRTDARPSPGHWY